MSTIATKSDTDNIEAKLTMSAHHANNAERELLKIVRQQRAEIVALRKRLGNQTDQTASSAGQTASNVGQTALGVMVAAMVAYKKEMGEQMTDGSTLIDLNCLTYPWYAKDGHVYVGYEGGDRYRFCSIERRQSLTRVYVDRTPRDPIRLILSTGMELKEGEKLPNDVDADARTDGCVEEKDDEETRESSAVKGCVPKSTLRAPSGSSRDENRKAQKKQTRVHPYVSNK